MADTIKILATEIALSTANTVSLGSLVRCYNNTAAQVTLTRANTGGTIGTMTMAIGEIVYMYKVPTDTLACSGTIRAVPVAFS